MYSFVSVPLKPSSHHYIEDEQNEYKMEKQFKIWWNNNQPSPIYTKRQPYRMLFLFVE